ncbi:MAG: glycoside hydrolase family 2 [Pirellulales bacterium]|nr:glycoside hydrolase family 2 [Pirellulales bacterium]
MNVRFVFRLFTILVLLTSIARGKGPVAVESLLPAMTREHRPWAYWWWMASAVDEENITRNLEAYQRAGLGGLHIVPIYGAKGYEDRAIPYLSPRWLEMLDYTVREADRLGLGIDMTMGTGWCFGGPWIAGANCSAQVRHETRPLKVGEQTIELPHGEWQAVMAYSAQGETKELTASLRTAKTARITIPGEGWQLLTVWTMPGRNVKRAASGGAGPMLNTFYRPAIEAHLEHFSSALEGYQGRLPRAMYHDSYEYLCNWSPHLLGEFEKRRGYRLEPHLPQLFGKGDTANRVRADFNRTLSELMLDDFLAPWVRWNHDRGIVTRNQAHGSPGNLLDLYAAADIAETEFFNRQRDPLLAKFATSAAHVAGRNRVSSETGTWLEEHFHESLGKMKEVVDSLFLTGVNHVFYHGTCYSPAEAAWPGWVFYASTQMNPRSAIWHDAPTLNRYVARCQAVLCAGQPDNDVLVYWPIEDYWHSKNSLAPMFVVSNRSWLKGLTIESTAQQLWKLGYAFDYISDRQLQQTEMGEEGVIRVPGGKYRAVVIPPCTHMPLETLSKLVRLADRGATVVFVGGLPTDVPGLDSLSTRRQELARILASIQASRRLETADSLIGYRVGTGRILVGPVERALASAGVARETFVDLGLQFIRRRETDRVWYFVHNSSGTQFDNTIELTSVARQIVFIDPMTGRNGVASITHEGARPRLRLRLESGETRLVCLSDNPLHEVPRWRDFEPIGEPMPLTGGWQLDFIDGGPELPRSSTLAALKSWTELEDAEAKRFAGTGRYRLTFNSPRPTAEHWRLDLGEVHESARVKLNGQQLGTLIGPIYTVDIEASALQAEKNELEIEVTNLSANRIGDLDRKGVSWKRFHDINIVNKEYHPLDASGWPLLPSGLVGPVTLQQLE